MKSLGLCAAGALFALTLAALPSTASAATCDSHALYIVAHEDDSLLFQTPDLLHDIRSGACVSMVYVTAGDAGSGQVYWSGREDGARAGYAVLAGVADRWTQSSTVVSGHSLPTSALTDLPTVTQLFMRLPDGRGYGQGFPAYRYESLQKLWEGTITAIHPVDGSAGYTRQALIDTLAALMRALRPDTIRIQDYLGTPFDHSDHYFSAYFARAAHQLYMTQHTLVGYIGYGTSRLPQNVFGADLAAKQDAFYTYAQHDPYVCQSPAECSSTDYDDWLLRQYVAGSEPGTDGARTATATASSQNTSTGQTADKAIDGVVDGCPGGARRSGPPSAAVLAAG